MKAREPRVNIVYQVIISEEHLFLICCLTCYKRESTGITMKIIVAGLDLAAPFLEVVMNVDTLSHPFV